MHSTGNPFTSVGVPFQESYTLQLCKLNSVVFIFLPTPPPTPPLKKMWTDVLKFSRRDCFLAINVARVPLVLSRTFSYECNINVHAERYISEVRLTFWERFFVYFWNGFLWSVFSVLWFINLVTKNALKPSRTFPNSRKYHCVKRARIRSYSGRHFSRIWSEYWLLNGGFQTTKGPWFIRVIYLMICVKAISSSEKSTYSNTVFYARTLWKVSKYGVISGPYFPVFEPEITLYLGTFHVVIHKLKDYKSAIKQT